MIDESSILFGTFFLFCLVCLFGGILWQACREIPEKRRKLVDLDRQIDLLRRTLRGDNPYPEEVEPLLEDDIPNLAVSERPHEGPVLSEETIIPSLSQAQQQPSLRWDGTRWVGT